MWCAHEGFSSKVEEAWSIPYVGEPMLQLCRKVKDLGTQLLDWDRTVFRSRREEVEIVRAQLDVLLQKPFDPSDRNSRFFHKKASHRRQKNKIKGLFNATGTWQESKVGIDGVVLDYFQSIFSSQPSDLEAQDVVLQTIEPRVSANMNARLLAPYELEEVRIALFQMHPSKAPGPDGLSPFFFQKYWDLVGQEVSNAVISMLTQAEIPPDLNFTFVTLIPKVKEVTNMSHLRPIALCNVIYKIASRVIANRLKSFLSDIVSPQQSAFVPNRLISDNTLVASELAHYMHKLQRGQEGFLALKLDISKAYDRLEWGFLQRIMLKMGFAEQWGLRICDGAPTISHLLFADDRWRSKLLSAAGREILIKVVAQALPLYTMNCYLLPLNLIQELHQLCAQFWWGSTDEKKAMHWRAWDELCKPKGMGGMGFRHLFAFNLAMLAKQGWRLIQSPDSLIGKLFKALYFPHGNFWEATLGSQPSYAWRSILQGRDILRAGIKRHIGNGFSTNIWLDPWLMDEDLRPYVTDRVTLVADLFISLGVWNSTLLSELFPANIVQKILSIPLSPRHHEDRWIWGGDKRGQFSVKSAYHVARIRILNDNSSTPNPSASLWRQLWTAPVPSSVKICAWKAASNILPTRSRLSERGIDLDTQ
ncbi:uncharacterized protein LOC133731138 [Rosa rugosa]|uniref:uncharacterized protein LOC133731138 n=1 Tax=Rosa rugosa TaxID=74645 RepID=UPI002B413166|nr:uncharacterized protein LOC133731138 [Rosa rugosa]